MKFIKHQRTKSAMVWLREESTAQARRYRSIVSEQEAIGPRRERWVAEFLERIQSRGYHTHFDQLRKIHVSEIPVRPKRKFRVVF